MKKNMKKISILSCLVIFFLSIYYPEKYAPSVFYALKREQTICKSLKEPWLSTDNTMSALYNQLYKEKSKK